MNFDSLFIALMVLFAIALPIAFIIIGFVFVKDYRKLIKSGKDSDIKKSKDSIKGAIIFLIIGISMITVESAAILGFVSILPALFFIIILGAPIVFVIFNIIKLVKAYKEKNDVKIYQSSSKFDIKKVNSKIKEAWFSIATTILVIGTLYGFIAFIIYVILSILSEGLRNM